MIMKRVYEEVILNTYLKEMETKEIEQIQNFIKENELNFLINKLLIEGHKFLYKRILILCNYISEKQKEQDLCRNIINDFIIVINEHIRWYLILKILVISEMILKNQL